MKTVYDFTVKDRKGGDISLKAFANEVLLIVNTATKCGFTPTYDELEATYKSMDFNKRSMLSIFSLNFFSSAAPSCLRKSTK